MKTSLITSRRRVLAGGAAAAVLATLAACGGSGSSSSGSSAGSSNAAAPGSAGGSGEPITITYWHRLPDGDGMTKVDDIVAQWNEEHPEIQVKATKFDGKAAESYAKIAQAVKSGDAPDLAQVGYAEIGSEWIAGDLEDVSAEIEAGGYADNYSAGTMAMCRLGDIAVGLPQDSGPLVYVYDKAAFDELGITAPTTWDELKESAKTAKAKGKYITTWQSDETAYQMSGQAAAAGATWFAADGDSWKVDIDSATTQKVAAIHQELIDDGLSLVLSDGRWGNDWGAKLTDGTLIGTVAAAWEPAFMLGDLGKEETDWQVTYLPKFGSEQMTGSDGGSAVAVIKGCQHKAEALQFANWFNTQVPALVSQGLVVAATTETPETPEAMKKLWGGQDVMGFLAKANETMNKDFPYSPTWTAVTTTMNEKGGKVATRSAKVEDIFTSAQTTAVSTLKDAGLSVSE